MGRIAMLILEEMEKKDCGITYFAKQCGLSRNELGQIVNRKKKDVRLSVIWSICENSEIRFSDIFEFEYSKELSIENFVLTNGRDRYVLKKSD